MKISLLVSNFYRAGLFARSLDSIVPQLTSEDEVVVVTDTVEGNFMKTVLDGLTSVHGIPHQHFVTGNEKYRSGVFAKNIALKACKNEVIIINDPEVYHLTSCINQIKELLKRDPRQFIVPGTMRSAKGSGFNLDDYNQMNHSMAPFIGGVMKADLMAINGWDERFKYWGNDDNDLMYRLGLNGTKHFVDDTMIAYHQWHNRPPAEAFGRGKEHCNHLWLNEENKSIIANKGKEWGVL